MEHVPCRRIAPVAIVNQVYAQVRIKIAFLV